MQFIRRDGVTLHYQAISAAGKPGIVFINSLGTDFRIWRDVVVRLAGDYSVLLYDKRGHGLSDLGPTPYTIDDHAADLAAVMDAAGFGRSIICGLSVGGLIAQQFYLDRPDLVAGLVFCGTAHRIGTADSWNDRIAQVEADGLGAIVDAVMARWFTDRFRAPDNAEFSGYRNMFLRTPVAGYTATCAAIRDADFTADAPRIAAPSLCIVGEADSAAPPDLVASFARLIPGARYELMRNAGHLPCVEQPEVLTAMIRAFSDFAASEDVSDRQRH